MHMMIHIERWGTRQRQQCYMDELMQMSQLAKQYVKICREKWRNLVYLGVCVLSQLIDATYSVKNIYISPNQVNLPNHCFFTQANLLYFFSKPPKSTSPLSTSLQPFLHLSTLPSTLHPLPFHISAEGRNINYYQYQFRHMNTDESISLSTSQNIAKLDRNHLLLKGDASAYFKQEVIIDFEPVKAIDPFLSPPRLSSFSIIPTFNRDSKYYTLAFVNPFDADQQEEDAKIRTQHETRVKEYSTQIAQKDILMPKPRHSDPYCGVCRQGFADYLEHINSSKHDNKVKKSRFSKFIVELGEDLFPQVRKSKRLISKSRK